MGKSCVHCRLHFCLNLHSFLQVTGSLITSRTRSKFGKMGQWTAGLKAHLSHENFTIDI